MSEQLLFWTGNLNPSITETILNDDGTPHDLTGQTVKFKMRPVGSSTLKVNQPATIVTPPGVNGQVRYDWQTADVDTPGQYLVWWEVTTTVGGKTQDMAEAVIEFRAHANVINYAELEQLKSASELTGTSFADQDLQLAISAASRGIDQATGRRFWLDPDATSVRYYTPELQHMLRIDDLVELTSLRVSRTTDGTFDETWTAGTEFLLEPLNAPVENPPRPWERITLRRYGYPSGHWLHPWFPAAGLHRTVELTGRFGWPRVPDEIVIATEILATKLVKRLREAPFGFAGVGAEGFAARIALTDPTVAPMLANYSRKRLLV
jgi:hypothetical protein